MKILHIVTFYNDSRSYGGPLTVAINLANEQSIQGHQVSILSLGENSEAFINEKVTFHIFKSRKIFGMFRFSSMHNLSSFYWLFRNANQYDVFHLHFSRDIFQVMSASILRYAKASYFLQTHNMLTNSEARRKPLQGIFDHVLLNKNISYAKKVLALHEVEKSALEEAFPAANTAILANGVRYPELSMNSFASKDVVFISRLHPQKNPMLFLEAAEMLMEKELNSNFLLAGPDGGLLHEVKVEIDRVNSEQLKYLGALNGERVGQVLSQSSILVLPSINDAFPMIVLEALSAGIPVIVTSSCQISAVIEDLGLGSVCEPEVDSLASSIRALLDNPPDRRSVYESSKSVFNLSEIVSGLTNTYEVSRRSQF
jgi:glycosyltransferase involved in cell wall biosynthesis